MRRLPAIMLSLVLTACTGGPVSDSSTPEASTVAALIDGAALNALPDRPDSLAGFDADGVRDTLGEPEFVWNEAGATMWRYRGRDCFVDVFLYDSDGVTYVDVRGDGLDDAGRNDCFRRLVEAHAAG